MSSRCKQCGRPATLSKQVDGVCAICSPVKKVPAKKVDGVGPVSIRAAAKAQAKVAGEKLAKVTRKATRKKSAKSE